MSIEWMRYKLEHTPRYDNPTWHNKVRHMSDAQVIAVYHKFLKLGYFDEKKPKKQKETVKVRQASIFDFMDANGVIDFTKPHESVFESLEV